MLGRHIRTALALGLGLAALTGCAPRPPAGLPSERSLRVGITPNSPPFASRQGGGLVGLEVDFARELTRALGRSLELKALDWDQLIPALTADRIDLIMSGMTITRARQVQIAFSDPYLLSGLIAVVRRGDAARYPDAKSVLRTPGSIGAVANTTGERFVREGSTRWCTTHRFCSRSCLPTKPSSRPSFTRSIRSRSAGACAGATRSSERG
jgi:ABC-type amino acid transport substrate-binding protein